MDYFVVIKFIFYAFCTYCGCMNELEDTGEAPETGKMVVCKKCNCLFSLPPYFND